MPEDEEPADLPEADGLDFAKAIARGLVGKTGPERRRSLPIRKKSRSRSNDPQYSGSGPDERDPQSLDASLAGLVRDRGWQGDLRMHGVFARWSAIVGDEIGRHSIPESFEDGRLVVRTDTTAWATQLTLLAPQVILRLNDELGDGTVTVVDVRGPSAPSWKRGKLRVKGRGPRDTYG